MAKKKQKNSRKLTFWILALLATLTFMIVLKVMSGYIATSRDKADFKKIEQDVLAVQSKLKMSNPQMTVHLNKYCGDRNFKLDNAKSFCTLEIKSNESYTQQELLKNTKSNYEAVLGAGFQQTQPPDYGSITNTGSVEKEDNSSSCSLKYVTDLNSLKESEDKYYFSFSCFKKVNKFIY